jgi:hypothetical protein
MINVDTDGCTFEDEENDRGPRLSGKTLSLWMINVVKDDISESEEDEEI